MNLGIRAKLFAGFGAVLLLLAVVGGFGLVQLDATAANARDIGERLSISENTVKVHLHNIYEKLGVEGRMELLLLAQELKIV